MCIIYIPHIDHTNVFIKYFNMTATELKGSFLKLYFLSTFFFAQNLRGLLFSYICLSDNSGCRTVSDCDGERTASYQAAPDQQSPVISELEIHSASRNRPRPQSSIATG